MAASAHHYCPNLAAATYVVLHSEQNLIFTTGLEMKQIALRLPGPAPRAQPSRCAISDGAEAACRRTQELAGA
jgi:hypothetical protein